MPTNNPADACVTHPPSIFRLRCVSNILSMIAHLPTSYDVPEQSDFKIIAYRQLFRRDVDNRRMIPTITVNLNLSFDFFQRLFSNKAQTDAFT